MNVTQKNVWCLFNRTEFEKLVYKEPSSTYTKSGEVLIKVNGAGVNNTDINTRLGWYFKGLQVILIQLEKSAWWVGTVKIRHGWGPLQFPRIQGGDICGRIESWEGVEPKCIGSRVCSVHAKLTKL